MTAYRRLHMAIKRRQKSTEMAAGSLPLGHAVATLLHAPRESLLLALGSDDVPDMVESRALHDVERFLLDQQQDATAASTSTRHVLSLFLEFGAGRRRGNRHQQIAMLVRWMLGHGTFGGAATTELSTGILRAHDCSRLKLAAALALLEALPLQRAARCVWSPCTVVELLRATLSACDEGAVAPSNVMVACADAAVACLTELCRRATMSSVGVRGASHGDNKPWVHALLDCTADAHRLLHVLGAWRRSQRLFGVAISELLRELAVAELAATAELGLARFGSLWLSCAPRLVSEVERRAEHVHVKAERWMLQLGAMLPPPPPPPPMPPAASSASASSASDPRAMGAVTSAAMAAAAASPLAGGAATGAAAAVPLLEEDDEACRARLGFEALCALALQLASLDTSSRATLFERLHPRLYRALCARCTSLADAALPLALLHTLLPTIVTLPAAAAEAPSSAATSGSAPAPAATAAVLLQPVLNLLQATDVPSAPVVTALAALAHAYPDELLADLGEKLGSPVATQCAAALAVLVRMAEGGADLSRLLGRRAEAQVSRRVLRHALQHPLPPMEGLPAPWEGATSEPGQWPAVGEWLVLLARLDPTVTLPQLLEAARPTAANVAPSTSRPTSTGAAKSTARSAASAPDGARLPAAAAPALETALEAALAAVLAGPRDAAETIGAVIDALKDGTTAARELCAETPLAPFPLLTSPAHLGPPVHAASVGTDHRAGTDQRTGTGHRTASATAASSSSGGGAADAAGTAGAAADAGEGGVLLLRALEGWVTNLDESTWPRAFRLACTKFFAAAQDVCSLQVLKRMLATTRGHDAWQALVVRAAVLRLEVVCKGSTCKGSTQTEADAAAATAVAGANADLMLYDRLRPLLLLQMLPEDGWMGVVTGVPCPAQSSGGDGCSVTGGFERGGGDGGGNGEGGGDGGGGGGGHADDDEAAVSDAGVPVALVSADAVAPSLAAELPSCARALLARVSDHAEQQPVRKMATALLARLPPAVALNTTLESMLARVAALGRAPRELATDATCGLALYYLCCTVVLHPAQVSMAITRYSGALISVLRAAPLPNGPRAAQEPDTTRVAQEALERLGMGCIDLLARTWCVGLEGAPREGSTMGEGVDWAEATRAGTDDATFAAGWPIERCVGAMLGDSTTISHALAIITLATRMRHAHGGAPAAAVLAARALPLLLRRSGAPITQALFELAFHSQAHLDAISLAALAERARADGQSAHEDARLAAVKLLGVVLAVTSTLTSGASASGGGVSGGAHDGAPKTATRAVVGGEALLSELYRLASPQEADGRVRALAQHVLGTAMGMA